MRERDRWVLYAIAIVRRAKAFCWWLYGTPEHLYNSIHEHHQRNPGTERRWYLAPSSPAAPQRAYMRYLLAFAAVGLALASIGIYGVISHSVISSYLPARCAMKIDPMEALRTE